MTLDEALKARTVLEHEMQILIEAFEREAYPLSIRDVHYMSTSLIGSQ